MREQGSERAWELQSRSFGMKRTKLEWATACTSKSVFEYKIEEKKTESVWMFIVWLRVLRKFVSMDITISLFV